MFVGQVNGFEKSTGELFVGLYSAETNTRNEMKISRYLPIGDLLGDLCL